MGGAQKHLKDGIITRLGRKLVPQVKSGHGGSGGRSPFCWEKRVLPQEVREARGGGSHL